MRVWCQNSKCFFFWLAAAYSSTSYKYLHARQRTLSIRLFWNSRPMCPSHGRREKSKSKNKNWRERRRGYHIIFRENDPSHHHFSIWWNSFTFCVGIYRGAPVSHPCIWKCGDGTGEWKMLNFFKKHCCGNIPISDRGFSRYEKQNEQQPEGCRVRGFEAWVSISAVVDWRYKLSWSKCSR